MSDITSAHCNNCLGDRKHEVLKKTSTRWSSDDYGMAGSDDYEMLKCRGCESVMMRHTSWSTEDPDATITCYPPAISRREPTWIYEISGSKARFLHALLHEVYAGMQNGLRMSSTMCVRALLECVIIDCVGDQGSFDKNLVAFTSGGYISDKQKVILGQVLEAGHAAIHRVYQPSERDISTCVDIAESVLQSVYVHPERAAELARRVPARKKPRSKKSAGSKKSNAKP